MMSMCAALPAVCFGPAARLNHPRGDCCAAAVAGKIYVAGGWTTDYADTLGSVEVFDPTIASAGWTFMPNLTMPRGDCETALLDDRQVQDELCWHQQRRS